MGLLNPNLSNPTRISLIKTHRAMRAEILTKAAQNKYFSNLSCMPTFESSLPKHLDLNPIFLKEIDRATEKVYENRVLKLTIIDEPVVGLSGLHFMTEDENQDAIPLSIYGLPDTPATWGKYRFGATLHVISPYLRIGALDGRHTIRVDDLKTLIYTGSKNDMCRYCGAENATKKCGECKRQYCDRDCQVADWKILKHKLVCKKYI